MKMIWYTILCKTDNIDAVINKLSQLSLPYSSVPIDGRHLGTTTFRVWTCSANERTTTALSLVFNEEINPVRVYNKLEHAYAVHPWDLGAFQELHGFGVT